MQSRIIANDHNITKIIDDIKTTQATQQHHHQHHPRWSQANTSYRSIIGNEHNLRNPVATPQQ